MGREAEGSESRIMNRLAGGTMAQYDNWSQKYDEKVAASIDTKDGNARFHYSPDFERAKLPRTGRLGPCVDIELTGSRSNDFKAANNAAHFAKTPQGFTWHHVFSEGGLKHNMTGTAYVCRMQLADSTTHKKTCAHKGSVAQWVALTQRKYKGVMEEDLPNQLFLPDTSPRTYSGASTAPSEIKAYADAGKLGGTASFYLSLGGDNWVYVYQTYGVLNADQITFFKACYDISYELTRLELYPVGEDEAGNLVLWHGGSGTHTLWFYDHEGSAGEIMTNSKKSLKDIFGGL